MKTRRSKNIGAILQPFSISAEPDSSNTVTVLLLFHQLLFPPLIGSMPLLNQYSFINGVNPAFRWNLWVCLFHSCLKENILLSWVFIFMRPSIMCVCTMFMCVWTSSPLAVSVSRYFHKVQADTWMQKRWKHTSGKPCFYPGDHFCSREDKRGQKD